MHGASVMSCYIIDCKGIEQDFCGMKPKIVGKDLNLTEQDLWPNLVEVEVDKVPVVEGCSMSVMVGSHREQLGKGTHPGEHNWGLLEEAAGNNLTNTQSTKL